MTRRSRFAMFQQQRFHQHTDGEVVSIPEAWVFARMCVEPSGAELSYADVFCIGFLYLGGGCACGVAWMPASVQDGTRHRGAYGAQANHVAGCNMFVGARLVFVHLWPSAEEAAIH